MVFTDQLHRRILNDPEWRAWGKLADNLTIKDDVKFGCDHGINHWKNVSRIAANFVDCAGGSHTEIVLADIAGLLHDIGIICGDFQHAHISSCMARAYLESHFGEDRPLSTADIEIICHAIKVHSDCNEINNLVDAAVMFADKIDIDKKRALVVANKIIQHVTMIQRISFNIDKRYLTIEYTVSDDFNESFFFPSWPKAYSVPAKVADYLGKELKFIINDHRLIWPYYSA